MKVDINSPSAKALASRWYRHFDMSVDQATIVGTVIEVVAHYESPLRGHHRLRHIDDLHRELEPIQHLLRNPAGVSLAVDVHDIIQETKVGNNEEASLKWARITLVAFGVPEKRFSSLASCVLATKHAHDAPPELEDAQYFTDADISVFGQSEERYQEYVDGVQHEYRWVPNLLYRNERAKVLQGFLDRKRLFWTEYFQDLYEVSGRKNVAQEVAELTKGL